MSEETKQVKQTNLFLSLPFWSVVITLLLNVIPPLQNAKATKADKVDTTLSLILALASAGSVIVGLTNSTSYYTPHGVLGPDKLEEKLNIVTDEQGNPLEDGNF